jgi:type IV secretory pathway VirB3-like protein
MQKSKVFHVMATPKLIFGIPKDFAILSFNLSLVLGGFLGRFLLGQIGLFIGTAFVALICWAVGYFMTKKDPEFLGVWLLMAFEIGGSKGSIALKGRRSYEP